MKSKVYLLPMNITGYFLLTKSSWSPQVEHWRRSRSSEDVFKAQLSVLGDVSDIVYYCLGISTLYLSTNNGVNIVRQRFWPWTSVNWFGNFINIKFICHWPNIVYCSALWQLKEFSRAFTVKQVLEPIMIKEFILKKVKKILIH